MSVLVQVADAVVATLAAGAYSMEFTPKREYLPIFELPDMQTLRVTVVPRGLTVDDESREHEAFDCEIDIGVQKKLNTETLAEVDALMKLTEEIVDRLRWVPLVDFPQAQWMKVENEPAFDVEHMNAMRQFTSVVSVVYRVWR